MRNTSGRRGFVLTAAAGAVLLAFYVATVRAAQPIPHGKDAYTTAQYSKDLIAFRMREVRLYEHHTKDADKVRQSAVKFLTAALNTLLDPKPTPTWKDLYGQGRQLITDGAADPVVTAWVGLAAAEAGQPSEAERLLRDAAARINASTYTAEMKFRVYEDLRQVLFASGQRHAFQPYLDDYVKYAVTWISHVASRPKDQRFLWSSLGTLYGDENAIEFQRPLYEAAKKAEKIDPWLMNMMAGVYHVRLAWHHRGGGTADQVTEEGSKSFEENLEIGAKHLIKAWEIDPKRPSAPCMMIPVAMAGSGGELTPRDWFDRTVAAQMDYEQAYQSLAWALRPRWGGSHREMYDFALECLATERFDTDVPWRFHRILLDIDSEMSQHNSVWTKAGIYEHEKQLFEGMEREPSRADDVRASNNASWAASTQAAVAICAHEYKDARRVLEKFGPRIQAKAFPLYGLSYPADAARAYALGGEAHDEAEKLTKLLAEEDLTLAATRGEARALLKVVAAKEAAAAVKPFLQYVENALAFQERLAKGDWVPLEFDAALACWQVGGGQWDVDPQQRLVGTPSSVQSGADIHSRIPLRGPLEIEVDVEFLAPAALAVGIDVGDLRPAESRSANAGRFFWVRSDANLAGVAGPSVANGAPVRMTAPTFPPSKTHHLWLRAWPNSFEFYIERREFHDTSEGFVPDGTLGLRLSGFGVSPVRFSNFRVRKLTFGPPPEDAEARIKYYTESIRRNADNAFAYYRRGVAHRERKEYEAAIADFEKAEQVLPELASVLSPIGDTYAAKGDYDKAIKAFEAAIKKLPTNLPAKAELAWLRATCPQEKYRNGADAVASAKELCQRSAYSNWRTLDILAAASAAKGDFTEAVQWGERAVQLAPAKKRAECQARLTLYRDKKPYHEPAPK
jgi:tetratricopeptide (TPR) repeat protein